MQIIDEIRDQHPTLVRWRRQLHRYPETAYTEFKTSDFIAQKLVEFGLTVHRGLAETGVIGVLEGKKPGRTIGLRADMDAIHASEANTFDHCSTVPGKMHGCGHDGHAVMLLGAAQYLAKHPPEAGQITFIFQPAEENEIGARRMVEEGLFEQFPMDAVFGIHNWPTLAAGEFAVPPDAVMASNDSFEITVLGKGCHAAMPHLGVDPIPIAARIVSALQTIVSRTLDPIESAVVTVTQIHSGSTWNVIPDQAVIRGSVRSFSSAVQDTIESRIRQIAGDVAKGSGAQAEVTYKREYPPTVNHREYAELAAQVARKLVGESSVHTNLPPSMGAEDFAYLLQNCPGAYLWLGTEDQDRPCVLHSPHYDFNDQVLPLGCSFWVHLAKHFLTSSTSCQAQI